MDNDAPLLPDPILSNALAETIADDPSLRYITHEIVRSQLKLRMPPEVIYAFLRTGYIVTSQNAGTFSLAEMEEWYNAQLEYFALAAQQTSRTMDDRGD